MFNISGFGLQVSLIASNTFPIGLILNNFPDDQDAISYTDLDIADFGIGVNADLITWTKGAAVKVAMSAIPDSPTDIQLALLLQANRIAPNKISARDIIQMVTVQGNGNIATFTNGIIMSGPPFNTVQSSGRMKGKTYNLVFESYYAV